MRVPRAIRSRQWPDELMIVDADRGGFGEIKRAGACGEALSECVDVAGLESTSTPGFAIFALTVACSHSWSIPSTISQRMRLYLSVQVVNLISAAGPLGGCGTG